MGLLDRIADLVHARGDAEARAQGLTVTRLPGGRRLISHPDLPAQMEARRRHVASVGFDSVDRELAGLTVHIPAAVTCENSGSDHIDQPAAKTHATV